MQPECKFKKCERPSRARGFCTLHYRRIIKFGDPSITSLTQHHDCDSPEYNSWEGMHSRCNDKKKWNYHRYGGRGITVCKRWNSYKNFIADMGRRPSKNHTLDRENNSLGYYPSNCRWATKIEQQNNMRNNRMCKINGKKMTVAQAARELGISYMKVWHKVNNSQPLEA